MILENKVVMITGGAGGQGRAHAVASAQNGADVVLLDIADPDSVEFKETIRLVETSGRRALAIRADITSQSDLDDAVASGIQKFGRIDSLIINAGIHRGGKFWEFSEADWDRVIGINLTGAWKSAKAVAPHMIERQTGSIIMISSVDAFDPEVDSTAYGVSKTGVLGLMKYVAAELAPHGVRCNAIAPGFVDTPMVNSQEVYDILAGHPGGTREDLIKTGRAFTALKGTSLLQGSDIADTAVYLNSGLAQYVTGVTIPVDAGHLLVGRVNLAPSR